MEDNKVIDIMQDISKITTIPERTLNKLVSKIDWCICDAVQESILCGNDSASVDVGVGTIHIVWSGEQIQYKFVPSTKLERYVADTIINKRNPLVVNLESTFVNRITKTYKDMF